MEKEPVTIDGIIAYLEESVKNREIIGPAEWLKYAQMLNVLLSTEHDALFNLEQKVAQHRLRLLEEQDSINISEVKLRVEATDDYRKMKVQKAKIGRIEELIRISKAQARLKENEFHGY